MKDFATTFSPATSRRIRIIAPYALLTFFILGSCFFYNYTFTDVNNTDATNIATVASTYNEDENAAWEVYTAQLFAEEIASNTLNLYYTLSDYESYDITNPVTTFGSFSTDNEESLFALENALVCLSMFDYDSLNEENRITYDVLQDAFTNGIAGANYTLFYEPLSPYTGLHTQLPILLAEFPLDSEEDVTTYLELLSTLPEYFASLISYEQAKAEAGLFMSNTQLDTVLEECAGFMAMEENYLLTTFDMRIASIEGLSDSQLAAYSDANVDTFYHSILPAYEELVAGLESLRNSGTNDEGLCYYANGMNYYAYLVLVNTGSSRTIPEIQVLIENQLLEDLLDLQEACLALETESLDLPNIDATYEEMLASLQESMAPFYPEIPEVSVTVHEIPEELEDFLSPAFYLIPTIDNTYDNTIYMNSSSMTDDITTYTTLAHEGYPGHLYQTTYFAATDPDPVRSLFSYGGYVEGWATYVEMCSYYLGVLDSPEDTILQKSASLHLGLYAYTDIGIHYEGWSLNDTLDFYQTFGITDQAIIEEIYDLIVATPSNYLKYYLGYLEFLELKKQCISLWGEDFTQMSFHQAVLDVGPVSFDILEKYVLS